MPLERTKELLALVVVSASDDELAVCWYKVF
jgi:hypothetical protein